MDNRSAILWNALELFSARGYEAVGVQEIVDCSGITKPTLYHYFGNKLGLMEAICQEYGGRLEKIMMQAADYHGDLPLSLYRLASAYLGFAKDNTAFSRLQLTLGFTPPESEIYPTVKEMIEKQYQWVEKLFREAARDHGNMIGRHRAFAATFIGTLNTYISLVLNNYIELDDEVVYKAVHQFMHGLYS